VKHLILTIQHTAILAGLTVASFQIFNTSAQAQQSSCVVTASGATICGKPASPIQAKPAKKSPRLQGFKVDNYIFTLRECQRFLAGTYCSITVVNNGPDRDLDLVARIHQRPSIMMMTDATRTTYRYEANRIRIGETSDEAVGIRTVTNNSYDFTLEFDRTASSVSKADSIILVIYIDKNPRLVEFVNVMIKPKPEGRY
jgi:hypothetical protein